MKINTAQAILYSTLIFAVSSDICDRPGKCFDVILKHLYAHDSFDCWKQCLSHNGCNYASFYLYSLFHDDNCEFYRECRNFAESADFVTSSRECAHCDFTGLCIVSINLANSD